MRDFENQTTVSADDFVLDKGFQVAQQPSEPPEKKPKKRHNVLRNIIWIFCIVVVSVGIAGGLLFIGADYLGIGGGRGRECTLEIEAGTATVQIAEQLAEIGAVKCPLAFRLYSKLNHYDAQYKYGVYTLHNDIGYAEIAELLMTEGAKAESVTVQIPAFATVDTIAALLAENGVCSESDFIYEVRNGTFDYEFIDEIPAQEVYYRLEGYLFADTYDFYCYDSAECAHLAVDKMLSAFNDRIAPIINAALPNSSYSFHEIVTLAAIVEGEAGSASQADANRVARVFRNRLEGVNWDAPRYLQSDPTTEYPYGKGRYSTYDTEGLPVGPTGSPSVQSVKAAVDETEKTDATYFVTDSNGKFYFNNTLAGHNATVADLKAKGMWVYSTLGNSQ